MISVWMSGQVAGHVRNLNVEIVFETENPKVLKLSIVTKINILTFSRS